MAQIVVNIPDPVFNRVIDAVAGHHGLVGVEHSRQAKIDFVHKKVREFLMGAVQAKEAHDAAEMARSNKIKAIESEINLT